MQYSAGIVALAIGVLAGRAGCAQHAQAARSALVAPAESVAAPAAPVLRYAEQMPAFTGGAVALHQYLAAHLTYPPTARRQGLSGEVVLQFTVDEQGRVLDPVVVRTTDAVFNDEARRLAWQMPWWVPGRQQGQPVRVRCTLPIRFTCRR